MSIIIKTLLNGLAVFATAYVVPGVEVTSFLVAVIVAIVLGVLNTLLKPILVLLTLPINFLTLGLFTLVINTGIIYLTSKIVDGFLIAGFLPALIFGIVLSIVNWFLSKLK